MITINMTGTEKQITWANDILNNPVKAVDSLIASNERIGMNLDTIPALRAAIAEYEAFINEHADKLAQAKFVIDRRTMFGAMIKESVRKALLAEGINPANTLANLMNI